MTSNKKYGGRIEHWYKIDASYYGTVEELSARYGPNLGYCIAGFLGDDPTDREFGHGPIRTSLVVKHDDQTIETLNTRYDLGDKRIER